LYIFRTEAIILTLQTDRHDLLLKTFPEAPEPQTYEECFTAFLSAQEIAAFDVVVNVDITAACSIIAVNPAQIIPQAEALLVTIGVDPRTIAEVIECLERVFDV
jgi:hypothetical protein